MLLGTHTPKLDDKGRVILPSKFRDDLGAGIVVTRGQDRCLYVFSTDEFERIHERIRETPLSNKQARDFLKSKQDSLVRGDKEIREQHGMKQFLDEKSYRPGLGPFRKVENA